MEITTSGIEFEILDCAPVKAEGEERFMTGKDLISKDMKEIPMLVQDIMPRVSLGGFIGESDAMKSTALLNLCEKIVADDRFDENGNIVRNKFVSWDIYPLHHRCLYYSTEDDSAGLSNRLLKQNKTMNLSDDELERLEVCFDFGDDFLMDLQQRLEKQNYDLVIVDGWEDIFTGDSYNNVQVRTYLNPIKAMAYMYSTNILLLNHIGKRTADLTPNKNHALGSQAWEAKMRYVFQWSKDKDTDNQCWFTIVKGNLISPKFKKQSYALTINDNLTFSYNGNTSEISEKEAWLAERQTKLNEECQAILELRDKGKTWQEIAEELNMSVDSVRGKYKRGKHRMKTKSKQTKIDFAKNDKQEI